LLPQLDQGARVIKLLRAPPRGLHVAVSSGCTGSRVRLDCWSTATWKPHAVRQSCLPADSDSPVSRRGKVGAEWYVLSAAGAKLEAKGA
jgi:hypothetical protein